MKIFSLCVSVLVSLSAGFIGSFFTANSVRTWYVTLEKPLLNPPSWVFGPVWTVLYVLMGIASYIIWQQRDVPHAKTALVLFGVQLFFNALWSILFFGFQSPGIALIEIVFLLSLIIVTMILFWRISVVAGILLVPYVLWVSFATYLNYAIWRLN
jgi:translocator protein